MVEIRSNRHKLCRLLRSLIMAVLILEENSKIGYRKSFFIAKIEEVQIAEMNAIFNRAVFEQRLQGRKMVKTGEFSFRQIKAG